MKSKPLAALLGLVLGFAAAAAGWKAWRLLTGLEEFALPIGGRTSQATPVAAPPGSAEATAATTGQAATDPQSPASIAGDKEPASADEAEGDRVLEALATETTARELPSVQSRFGASAFPPDEDGACPPEQPVKGNAKSMIFHQPGQSSYGATIADVCFPDAAAAEAAGFRPSKSAGQARP